SAPKETVEEEVKTNTPKLSPQESESVSSKSDTPKIPTPKMRNSPGFEELMEKEKQQLEKLIEKPPEETVNKTFDFGLLEESKLAQNLENKFNFDKFNNLLIDRESNNS